MRHCTSFSQRSRLGPSRPCTSPCGSRRIEAQQALSCQPRCGASGSPRGEAESASSRAVPRLACGRELAPLVPVLRFAVPADVRIPSAPGRANFNPVAVLQKGHRLRSLFYFSACSSGYRKGGRACSILLRDSTCWHRLVNRNTCGAAGCAPRRNVPCRQRHW